VLASSEQRRDEAAGAFRREAFLKQVAYATDLKEPSPLVIVKRIFQIIPRSPPCRRHRPQAALAPPWPSKLLDNFIYIPLSCIELLLQLT
jgi:hypothetical protein